MFADTCSLRNHVFCLAGASMSGTMITSVLPVRATGQSIHVRAMITSVLPVRANGQSIHVRVMITSLLPG